MHQQKWRNMPHHKLYWETTGAESLIESCGPSGLLGTAPDFLKSQSKLFWQLKGDGYLADIINCSL